MSDRKYDPNSLGDNTGIQFQSAVRPEKQLAAWEADLIKAPAWLNCKNCNSPTFRVQCDTKSEHVRFICNGCRWMTRTFRMQAPQLNDEIAKRIGLYVVDQEIEL